MHKKDDKVILAPSDLSNFLSCRHLSKLDLDVAEGAAHRPSRYGPFIEELRARGMAHEQAYLAHLQELGLSISGAGGLNADGSPNELSLESTQANMQSGVDIIYQAKLSDEAWSGRADFLRKVDRPSDLGDFSYEVIDTKLARDTRAGTILQLCVYSFLLEKLQGLRPEYMYVVTPGNNFSPLAYRIDDYSAYFRLIERNIGQFLNEPAETYPDLVSHCDLCVWWGQCEKRRREDDHLCYVAGISGSQIEALREIGVNRLAKLAVLTEIPEPRLGSKEALIRVREQARVQLIGREQQKPYYELKEPFDVEHGLALLPEPTVDDIFLDFEGSHFSDNGPNEYLIGYVVHSPDNSNVYTPLWASTPKEERQIFEQFMDLAKAVRARNPRAHIYHFAPYEPAALKRLMGRYATREVELDELLRGRAFVDLYAVVKRALIAGVERYSIKDLEPFFGYQRQQELREASLSRRIIENAIEAGDLDGQYEAHRRIVEDYNREDCESTIGLRNWLEELRAEVLGAGHDLPRPVMEDGEASDSISDLDQQLQQLRDGLLEGVPEDPEDRSAEEQARFTLAHMMEFHRREEKASWWEYFRLLDLDEEDYADERRALYGLQLEKVLEPSGAPLERYHFPPQEIDVRPRDAVYDANQNRAGTVKEVNYGECTVDIKRSKATAEAEITSVVFHNRVPADQLRQSLMRFGEFVLAGGFVSRAPYRAAIELLLRKPPSTAPGGDSLQGVDEQTIEAACRLTLSLDGQVLAIQGPPGTGKTYTGAHIICELKKQGLKVGVSAVSHKVIVKLMEEAIKVAREEGVDLRAIHKQAGEYDGDFDINRVNSYPAIRTALDQYTVDVVGATAWCWSRPEFEQSVDVLIVDEAGQMSLSNVLAVCPSGKNLVLLGDPQQLEQPLQSSHPEGSEVSALAHWLEGEDTMPANRGLFLDETYRLHPDIAQFTSEVYYEGKLRARPDLANQAIVPRSTNDLRYAGSGLRYHPVFHTGNQARSLEEVVAIREIADELLTGAYWQDKDLDQHELVAQDILIVAPYNAQVAALVEALPELAGQIGTVDRFQGQEAPVVIYSMTSSSPTDAPRGMEFLYNGNRFNVATSRARALCILVGSPALFEPECRTPKQMKMANGFCRYLELVNTGLP